jgi:hypothetical protein
MSRMVKFFATPVTGRHTITASRIPNSWMVQW